MNERNRKLLGSFQPSDEKKRELYQREIQRPDGVWTDNWFGWNYMLVEGEWVVTPDSPMFNSEDDAMSWLNSSFLVGP